jgi:hypothetical protein
MPRSIQAYQGLRRLLGFDTDPLEDVRSAQLIETTRQANVSRALTQDRAEREFDYKREYDGYKLALSQMTKVFEKLPPGPLKDHQVQQMQALWYNAPPRIRHLMQGASFIRPISPEEERGREFDETHPYIPDLKGEDGLPLPWTEDNEPSLVTNMILQSEQRQQRAIVKYGLAEGKALQAG